MKHLDPYIRLAPVYDLFTSPFLEGIRKDICELIKDRPVKTVVDLGCGTGRQCALLAEYGFETYGVDLSGAMLKKARANSKETTYFQEDISRTHFLPHSFDCAVLSLVLHEHPSQMQNEILSEALRIIRPEGYLSLLDHGRVTDTGSRIMYYLAHIPERFAGKEHLVNYRSFVSKGGLQNLTRSLSEIRIDRESGYYLNSLWHSQLQKTT